MIRFGKRVRAGFTLVEMLVVIVIIAILAGLITAAAANAMWSAKQTKIKVEVDMLAAAMEAFKQKYNSYPPTNLTCPQDANMLAAANTQLTAFVARAFPRYSPVTMNSASPPALMTLPEQIGYDLTIGTGSVVLPNPTVINPQNALVFWLSGFTSDPTDPFNRTGSATLTRSSFFSFDQTRLLDYSTGLPITTPIAGVQTGTPYGNMIYNAPYGNAAYCYFDSHSYGTLMYPTSATTFNVGSAAPLAAFGSPPTYAGIAFASTTSASTNPEWLTATGATPSYAAYVQIFNGTGYVMPYAFDLNNSGSFNVGDTFCKPTSFQIISAGQDGCFGTIAQPTQGRLYPTGYNYDVPPPGGGSGDDDNVTNFCEKNTLESAKP